MKKEATKPCMIASRACEIVRFAEWMLNLENGVSKHTTLPNNSSLINLMKLNNLPPHCGGKFFKLVIYSIYIEQIFTPMTLFCHSYLYTDVI